MAATETVVGWDGSAEADEALTWAADHAAARDGRLHLVRVLSRDTAGEPADRVARARLALDAAARAVERRDPGIVTTAELVAGDPATELDRIAGHDRLLVLGASRNGRIRWIGARRIPLALAARPAGATAIVPAGRSSARGVVAVVTGRDRTRAAVDFAVDSALERDEPLTVVRLHDPFDLGPAAAPLHLEQDVQRLRERWQRLDVRLAPGWVSSPYGLLTRSDGAALLVLEGSRASAAPPSRSLERWLAGQAREPFVIVAEAMPHRSVLRSDHDAMHALAS